MNAHDKHSLEAFDQGKQRAKDKELYLDFIRRTALNGIGISYRELKRKYTEDRIFFLVLQHVIATKKAVCTAFDLQIEQHCWTKRKLEKVDLLVQTPKRHKCKFTNNPAHYLTTDPDKFDDLLNNFER